MPIRPPGIGIEAPEHSQDRAEASGTGFVAGHPQLHRSGIANAWRHLNTGPFNERRTPLLRVRPRVERPPPVTMAGSGGYADASAGQQYVLVR